MSYATEVLERLEACGLTVELSADGDSVLVRPGGRLTSADQAAIRQAKPELLVLLRRRQQIGINNVVQSIDDLAAALAVLRPAAASGLLHRLDVNHEVFSATSDACELLTSCIAAVAIENSKGA